ncbi:MAG: OmpA/MotB domain protein [Ferruginibacter sp.]|uniref:OmpA family protein n=1 Tax=Ferruginibacter sp. TaxID=1940288 RepID=UPI00265952B5|nr:OmpA family protein [Ferruginibacter sp.]MDB5278524.1 OmpA/MotB domain protein [Ferruginibacter sp.]
MKKLLLICTCLAFTYITNAQTQDKKWNIGLHGGATQSNTDYVNDFYKGHMPFYAFGGLSVSRYLGGHFDLSLLATKGKVGYSTIYGRTSQDFTTTTLNARFHLLGPNTPVRPYLFVGGGVMIFDKNLDIKKSTVDYITPSYGVGVNFKMGPSVMLNIQETFLNSSEDKRDGVVKGGNDSYLMHMVGLTFNFGKKKDADKDGVADRNDKCPNTPAGVAVDKTGCPLDKDADGVADYLDKCPDVAGVAALMGCPDKDGDGITDAEDRCPDVAGSLAMKGCPDTDKDGVADIDDHCPDTKAGYKVDAAGCPMDNDKDGIVNEDDRCPDAAGPASLKGCPDTDGDGVADIDDRCPAIKGTIANKGCPEMTVEEVKKITEIASKIFFENNSDKLKVASLVQLDELTTLLKKYENANLSIGGYTDSKGTDAYNLTLSQKRTESVKKYLISKGITDSRLSATGYGETLPIADNKTALGRAKNRRVELKTSY